jgi:hypothetical protein
MKAFLFVPPRNVRDLESPAYNLAMEMFNDKTDANTFVVLGQQLHDMGFDFNGLHSGEYTIGHVALLKGEYGPLDFLDMTGYNFAIDPETLFLSQTRWGGMFHRTVALAARKFDPTLSVPTLESQAEADAVTMFRSPFRNVFPTFRWDFDEPEPL